MTTFTSSRRATNARLPHAKRPPPGGYVQTLLPDIDFQIGVANRDYHYLSHSEIAGGKRISQLRDRSQDIPALVQHFLHRGARTASITPGALAVLNGYHWPGNVRELENTIERAIVLAREGIVTDAEIELRGTRRTSDAGWAAHAPLENGWETNVAELEKSLIERALCQAQGNKSRAAELLGINRRLLYEKLKQYEI